MEHLSGPILLTAYTCVIIIAVLACWGFVAAADWVINHLKRRVARQTRTYNKVSPYQVLKGIQE